MCSCHKVWMTFLSLSFLICNMGIISNTVYQGYLGLNECGYVKCLT